VKSVKVATAPNCGKPPYSTTMQTPNMRCAASTAGHPAKIVTPAIFSKKN
jgi:hypothetical protein